MHRNGPMYRADFIERVEGLGSFGPGQADAATRATLEALGAALLPAERRTLAEGLPEELAALVLEAKEPRDALDLERFYQRVQRHESVRSGRAHEHAQIVCRVLATVVPGENLALVGRRVPWLAPLFEAPERTETPAPEVLRRDAPTNTLAGGRPGSRHPLSSAVPRREQSQSVAATDSPHADTKLSSSRGLTQERENETLASGHPGSKRPLSR